MPNTNEDKDLAVLRKMTSGSKSGSKALANVEAYIAELRKERDQLNLKVARLHNGNDFIGRWYYERHPA